MTMQANSGKFQLSDEPRRAKIPRDLNLVGELSRWRARIENSRGVPRKKAFGIYMTMAAAGEHCFFQDEKRTDPNDRTSSQFLDHSVALITGAIWLIPQEANMH
jgi:hypothetical protein